MNLASASCLALAGCHLVFELEEVAQAPDICPSDPDLRLCIDFEHIAGDRALDRSGNDNHAELPPDLTMMPRGRGRAVEVDATTTIRVPNGSTLDVANDLTIDLWFGHTNLAQYQGLIDTDNQYGIGIESNFQVSCTLVIGGVQDVLSAPVSSGIWHHVTCVRRGAALEIYIDGRFDESDAVPTGTINVVPTLPLFLARDGDASGGSTSPLTGRLDDVRIFGRALSATEIEAHVEATR